MKNRTFPCLLASAVIFTAPMAGCSGAGINQPKVAGETGQALGPKIERALAEKDAVTAVSLAEQMVGTQTQDGNARALLGRAYLASGRYVSARIAFNDALTLGNRDPRTIVSLSLAEAGMGNLSGARQLLSDHVADLSAGDYGLAMAMAGDTQEGVRALIEASRRPDATAKTRQNLAYALAMGGAWRQARLVAGQDLTAHDAEARMAQWSQSFTQAKGAERVVAMLGIAPRADDAGLPAQLALNAVPKATEQVASVGDIVEEAKARDEAKPAPVAPAESQVELTSAPVQALAPQPVMTPDARPTFAPGTLAAAFAKAPLPRVTAPAASNAIPAAAKAAIAPAPLGHSAVSTASEPAPVAAAFSPSPATSALANPAASRSVAQAVFRRPVASPASSARVNWAAALGSPVADSRASDWVVQLGAFDSEAVSRDKWLNLSKRRHELRPYSVVNSTIARGGRTFYRLAIRGFENRGAAASACSTLRSSGQACFVRLDDTASTRQARDKAQASAEQPGGRSRPSR